MIDPLFQRQIELETQAVENGIKRYRDKLAKGQLEVLEPGVRLMHILLEPTAKAVYDEQNTDQPGPAARYRKFYRKFDPMVVSYIVSNTMIQAIGSLEPISVQRISIEITNRLLMELDYRTFKEEAPGYVYAIEQDNKWASEAHRRRTVMRAKAKFSGRTEMSQEERFKIGNRLLHLFIEATGVVEERTYLDHQGNRQRELLLSQEAYDALDKAHKECELMSPMTTPMLVRPKPWLTTFGGGFISNHHTLKHSLVKTRDRKELFDLGNHQMPQVYKAINTLQETKWRVNGKVLETLDELWQGGGDVAGLPANRKPATPSWPGPDADAETMSVWRRTCTKIHETWARETSKRVNMMIKLKVAFDHRDQNLYFVWTMDWRGRMYPVQQFLNPHGDDSSRSLIEFAEGKPIGTNGKFWLAVHGANCWGFDKVSFRERVDFIYEMEKEIFMFADDPVGTAQIWGAADKPFQFLAFCFEWTEMRRTPLQSAYISHLPVSIDGSCNGLQNLSALLLDEVGGTATNLVPGAKPADVYQQVADVLITLLEKDMESPDLDAKEKAFRWHSRITRKVVKRGVMTTPYGVTKSGLRMQLRHECEKIKPNYLDLPDGVKASPYYTYLADRLWVAIGEVVVAAREAMIWLQEVAKICTASNKTIRWTTPVGFRVRQSYPKVKSIRVNTFFGQGSTRKRHAYTLALDTPDLNKVKMLNGIAPNFVHSLDAAHLMHTVNRCYDYHGIADFIMIHDSFGTHACDVEALAYELREAFIDMYTLPILDIFGGEIFNQVGQELPEQPPKGALQLSEIRDSKYFFG